MKTDKEYKLTVESRNGQRFVITEKRKNKQLPNLSAISGVLEVLSRKNGN